MRSILFAFFVSISCLSAQKSITLEQIWVDRTFIPDRLDGLNFLNDGQHFTIAVENRIIEIDLLTLAATQEVFNGESFVDKAGFNGKMDSYEFNADESQIFIKSETESIYRRSKKAKSFLLNRSTGDFKSIHDGEKIMNAHLNPAGDKVAYNLNNDIYIQEIGSGKITRVTSDGEYNKIINGAADWVYEEEFSLVRAFEWNATGDKLAFIRFDETEVKEFILTKYHDEAYPEYVKFKYPKVGEKNSKVSVHLYDLNSKKTTVTDLGDLNDIYLPRIVWTKNQNDLIVFKMNRHQNHLQLLKVDATTGKSVLMMEEKNKYYIDLNDDYKFLDNGKQFIWTSEKSGFNHIYLYDLDGREICQLTKGNYDVTSFYGVDEKRGLIYFQSAPNNPMQRQVNSVNLKGKKHKVLSPTKGTSRARFTGNFDYFINIHSSINSPPSYKLHNNEGEELKVIIDNKAVKELQKEHHVSEVEFFKFTTSEDVELNGYKILPPNFDETKKYPVFMYLYGGPNSQQVVDLWRGQNYWWFQMLAQQGYIVACVDNRGTGARGEEFRKMTYLQLGKYETIDQIEAAKYLGNLPYTDASRIGIFGWSYGGYMSTLCLLKGNDVFSVAIAVAPVTNWKWYDTVYTERYMRTDTENESGYRENSPIYFADRLKGDYLLVHGMGDDNVHFQNTVEMANALIRENKQFDTYYYPNRAHGIRANNARIHLYTKMTNFLLEKL